METRAAEITERAERELPPLVGRALDLRSITEQVSAIPLAPRTPRAWLLLFAAALFLVAGLLSGTVYLFAAGVGIWGVNIPVAWGLAIVNFVWWIGIGHAGTLISAILLLLNQKWRTSINRLAETMTLFAVLCAGMFPILHLGRPWLFYWLVPYPNTMEVWPQFRSPLVWDFFAVSTYLTISLVFWYVGLLPDLAAMRDRARGRLGQIVFGLAALGWRGAARHWQRHQAAYLLLAGLATPLVVSVHTVVSFDFTIAIVPGWHSTIFPPYFVAGAIYSGFAMVLTIAIPLRACYGLKDYVTERHLDNMAKVMLATGLVVAYGYMNEFFMSWYGADRYEEFMTLNRALGPYRGTFWAMLACNVFVPQLLWWRTARRRPLLLWGLAMVVNVGMWLERFVIVVTSLHRDFRPAMWGMYQPTRWDWLVYAGTVGFFIAGFLLFARLVPMISMSEMKELVHEEGREREERGRQR